MTVSPEPGLYGIVNSSRSGRNLWGKNEFNSTFPIALCCYMRDNAIRPVYVAVNEMTTSASDIEITIEDAFGTRSNGKDIRFEFESTFQPYQGYCSDALPHRVSRSLREAARHTRCLYSLLTEGRLRYGQVYAGMSLGNQTDKSFAVNGSRTWTYLRHPRLERPFFSAKVLKSLILNGGHRLLSPERRFDAAIYYTWND